MLQGGSSRRMGQDKALIEVGGVALARHIAGELAHNGWPPTLLGGDPLPPYPHRADPVPCAGPLAALRAAEPGTGLVFVCSCDVPRFEGRVATVFEQLLGKHDAVVPQIEGRAQPLAGLYRASAWERLPATGDRVMAWLDRLDVLSLDEQALRQAGVPPIALRGANTPQELQALLDWNE